MTIPRAYTNGFSVGEKVSSLQLNGIDENTTFALDKRSGQSDTLASTVSVTGTMNLASAGKVRANATGAIIEASASGAKIAATASGASIEANASGAKIAATVSGATIEANASGAKIAATVSGASIEASASGAKIAATVSGASIEASASGAKVAATASGASIAATVSGAKIVASAAGALIRTETGGRLELGDNDYPVLPAGHTGRTVVRVGPLASHVSTTDQGNSFVTAEMKAFGSNSDGSLNAQGYSFGVVNTGSSTLSRFAYCDLTPCLINGATLTQVSVIVQGAIGHAGLPARMPRIAVARVATFTSTVLHSAGAAIVDGSANTTNYQAVHTIAATCDQNNVVDKTTYRYVLVLWNEGGTNGLVGLSVGDVVVTQTIVDLRTA